MGVVLVLLPGGAFSMGVTQPTDKRPLGTPNVDPGARSSEGPVHEIVLAPFFMGKHELTQGQWRRFTGDNPAAYLPGSEFGGRKVTLAHPVEQVRWREARAVLQHMDLRLPTEAQWEYASRAGATTVYWTGDHKRSLRGAVNIADRYCMTHEGPGSWRYEDWLDDGYTVHAPVGTYRANAFGLHDTAGNVWEWVEDRYGGFDLPVRSGDGLRASPEGAPRVFRGGGFRAAKVHARSADRYSLYAHEFRAYDVGVRAARRVDLAEQ
jgi:formylglycine-generating enzyme required for sulfatase activity